MDQTVLTIRTNTRTLSNYEASGDAFARGVPRISYGSSFRVKWYLYSATPGYGSPGVDIETWTPDTSYDNCLALFTCDNDYRKKVTGSLSAPLEHGQVVTEITATFSGDTAKLYIPSEGILTLYDEIGEEEYIAYSCYNATETSITFSVPDGYTMASSYAAGDELSAPQEPLFSANMVVSESDTEHGLFVFDVAASSRKFRDLIEGKSKVPNLGFELLPYQLVNPETGQTENRPSFLLSNVTLTQPIGDSGYPASVPPSSQNMILSNIASVIAAGDELQFTANTASESAAHTTQTDSDTHYRFRNAVAQGDWSPWIKLPKGVKGDTGSAGKDGVSIDTVKQTTTSTVSGGTNVVTVTLSDGSQFSFNVWNGAQGEKGDTGEKGATGDAFHFDAIGTLAEKDAYNDEAAGFAYLDTENGNIYIKNSETSADWTDPIPFRGERGSDGVSITSVEQTTTSTASEGTNVITVTLSDGQTFSFTVKNGAAGKTGEKGDAGTPGVQGPAGENGLTPYIGTNKNWWVGTEDTGVLAEGSNLFANGVPPFEFTAADLTDGILSRTFADLGIDSALPVSVNIIDGNGVIMDGDVRLAMIWTDTGLDVDLTQFEAVNGTWKLVFAGGTNGTSGGSGSGNGYLRSFTAASLTAQSGGWYIATASDITITLPSGNTGRYVRISTTATANNVVIAPASGETIDGDSEGLVIDKTSGTTELFWNGTGWIVIEAK